VDAPVVDFSLVGFWLGDVCRDVVADFNLPIFCVAMDLID